MKKFLIIKIAYFYDNTFRLKLFIEKVQRLHAVLLEAL
jgi:hypothetical protein